MSDLFFSTDLLGEFDRLQRQMASLFSGFPASLRAMRSYGMAS
jgi:HSP20 family protein